MIKNKYLYNLKLIFLILFLNINFINSKFFLGYTNYHEAGRISNFNDIPNYNDMITIINSDIITYRQKKLDGLNIDDNYWMDYDSEYSYIEVNNSEDFIKILKIHKEKYKFSGVIFGLNIKDAALKLGQIIKLIRLNLDLKNLKIAINCNQENENGISEKDLNILKVINTIAAENPSKLDSEIIDYLILKIPYFLFSNFNPYGCLENDREKCYLISIDKFFQQLNETFLGNNPGDFFKKIIIVYDRGDLYGNNYYEGQPERFEKITRIMHSKGYQNFGELSFEDDLPHFYYWNAIHRAMYNE